VKGGVLNTFPTVDTQADGSSHLNYVRQAETVGSPFDVAAPAANLPATVAYGAQQQTVHSIGGVAWSYSAAPTGGNLSIVDAPGNLIFSMDVTASGPGSIVFDPPKMGSAGRSLIITLTAGGGSVIGKVSVLGHQAIQLPPPAGNLSFDFSQAADSGYLPLV
jgi:hypothetical protein